MIKEEEEEEEVVARKKKKKNLRRRRRKRRRRGKKRKQSRIHIYMYIYEFWEASRICELLVAHVEDPPGQFEIGDQEGKFLRLPWQNEEMMSIASPLVNA